MPPRRVRIDDVPVTCAMNERGVDLVDEERSEEEDVMSQGDLDFLDDGEDISEGEDDRNAIDMAMECATRGVLNLNGEEVSINATRRIRGNKRKAERKKQAVAVARRAGSVTTSSAGDRGANQRNWCFTGYVCPELQSLFDLPDDDFVSQCSSLMCLMFEAKKIAVSFLCVGKESCPTTGRIHLQCFAQFASKKRISCLKKVCPTIHWECCKGTPNQNRDYCRGIHATKSLVTPNVLFSEKGDLPLTGAEGTKQLWVETLELARRGSFLDISPRILISQVRNLEHIHRRFGHRVEFVNPMFHTGVWIYSRRPGRGKTSSLRAQFPSVYLKAQDHQWNDYSGQEYALIDDFALDQAKSLGPLLKNWTDHLMFPGRVLYGTVQVHLRHLFVTSNYSLFEMFGHLGEQIYQPIRIRFREFDWDDGDLTWQDRAADCWSEANILSCPLGETQGERRLNDSQPLL